MRHKLIKVDPWGTFHTIRVELVPDTEAERKTIENVDQLNASDEERSFMDNYVQFNINVSGFTILEVESQSGVYLSLKAKKISSLGGY